jgi:ATP/maltotriose-dependent transcriptional regulator MalT
VKRGSDATALLDAIRSQLVTQPIITSEMLEHELLTAREREILGLIGNALSNKEIARRLQISDKTVKTHLHHIYVNLHQSGRYRALLSSSGLRLK